MYDMHLSGCLTDLSYLFIAAEADHDVARKVSNSGRIASWKQRV